MNDQPLISVIVPTYNRAHLLPRAVNSILNQTYGNFELIIVNDGSIDGTEKTIDSFKDNRIVSYTHEKNKGVLAAVNTGFNLTKGKYIATMGDDDELMPYAFATVVKYMEIDPLEEKILWFGCIDSESGLSSGQGPTEECDFSYEDYLSGRITGDHWIVLHKNVLKENRFDERLHGCESILWLKLHQKFKAQYIPKVVYKAYREHGERITTASPLKHLQKNVLTKCVYLEEFGEDLKRLNPKDYGLRLAQLGFLQILNDEKVNGKLNLRKSFKYNFSLRYFGLYLMGYFLTANQIKKFYVFIFEK